MLAGSTKMQVLAAARTVAEPLAAASSRETSPQASQPARPSDLALIPFPVHGDPCAGRVEVAGDPVDARPGIARIEHRGHRREQENQRPEDEHRQPGNHRCQFGDLDQATRTPSSMISIMLHSRKIS
jgi:hypothetical protein